MCALLKDEARVQLSLFAHFTNGAASEGSFAGRQFSENLADRSRPWPLWGANAQGRPIITRASPPNKGGDPAVAQAVTEAVDHLLQSRWDHTQRVCELCEVDEASSTEAVRDALKAAGSNKCDLKANGLDSTNRRQRGRGRNRVYYFVYKFGEEFQPVKVGLNSA